jgi:hypoxanthine phosphoribosyltransferase
MKDPSERLSRDQIARRVRELAESISADYARSDLVLIGILRGAFVFLADLVRQVTVPVAIDFVGAASYGSRTQTLGQVGYHQGASASSLRAGPFAG